MADKNPTIVITGGNGFIGQNLIQRISDLQQWKIWSIIRPGAEILCNNSKINFIPWDIKNPATKNLLPEKPECIIHLAAIMDKKIPHHEIAQTNTMGTLHLLEYAKASKTKRFIYISTGGVAGYSKQPIREDISSSPHDIYTLTKWQGEEFTRNYADSFCVGIFRLFFPYGPGQNRGIIPMLIERLKSKTPITVFNNENPHINPIYIEDLLDIILFALTTSWEGIKTLNIAGPERVSIRNLAENLAEIIDCTAHFEQKENPNILDLVADITTLQSWWGKPRVSLKEGIAISVPK